jgi:tetratricopeptide (TPR) repeat protein
MGKLRFVFPLGASLQCFLLMLWLFVGSLFCVSIPSGAEQGPPQGPGSSPSADAARGNAIALEEQGKNGEAESAWRAIAKAHPADAEAYAHLGLLKARADDYKGAIALYRKALALNPTFPGLRLNLGLALFKNADMEEAIKELNPLLKEATPGSSESQRLNILIGMAHYGQGEFKEAVPYLKVAADNDQENLPLRLTLGHSCMWSKQYQCVLDTYHEILALNASSAEADLMAGEALDELKDDTGAIEQFHAAIKANPKEQNVHFGLGYLLWKQKKFPDAAAEFKIELENDPDHAKAMAYLADAEIQLNQMEQAVPLLQHAAKLSPALQLAHLDLGIVYAEDGKQDAALREFETAEKLDADNVDVHWRLGRLYHSMGRNEEARAQFDKARGLNKAADDRNYQRMSGSPPKPIEPSPGASTQTEPTPSPNR